MKYVSLVVMASTTFWRSSGWRVARNSAHKSLSVPAPASRATMERRPTTPAMIAAAASPPLRTRKPRRDQAVEAAGGSVELPKPVEKVKKMAKKPAKA